MNGYERAAAVLKALAHPVRLQIMDLLAAEGDACVCHLEVRLDQRQAYVSQQLARLRQAGLVEDRREGSNVFYSLATRDIGTLIAAVKQVAETGARASGMALAFAAMPKIEPSECPCPNCGEELAAPGAIT